MLVMCVSLQFAIREIGAVALQKIPADRVCSKYFRCGFGPASCRAFYLRRCSGDRFLSALVFHPVSKSEIEAALLGSIASTERGKQIHHTKITKEGILSENVDSK
jgi:hypothetical protein